MTSEQGQNGASPGTPDEEQPKMAADNSVALKALFVVSLIEHTCMFLYMGAMPFIFKQYGMSPVNFAFTMSAFCFLTFLTSPALGRVGDVFGSRVVLLICCVSTASSHLTMALSGGVYMLVCSRALALFMDVLPASQMSVTDLVPEKDRGRYLGKIMIPFSIGMIVGPTLGGTISDYLGPQQTLMLTWLAPLVGAAVTVTYIPKSSKVNSTAKSDGRTGGLSWKDMAKFVCKGDIPYLIVARFLVTLPAMIMTFQLVAINCFHLTPQANGMLASAYGLMTLANNWYVLGFVSRQFTGSQLLRWVSILSVPSYLLLSVTQEIWQLVIAMYLVNLCYTILDNQILTRLTGCVEAKDTGIMVGIGTALFYLSRTVSPTLGGLLLQRYGWSSVGQLGVLVSILLASLSVFKYR